MKVKTQILNQLIHKDNIFGDNKAFLAHNIKAAELIDDP